MSVLERLRSGSDSSAMQVVLVVIILSFLGWSAFPQGDGTDVIATVNGVRILGPEFRRTYARAVRYQEAVQGRSLTDAEQKQIADQVREVLVDSELLTQRARSMGMEVSEREVAWDLVRDPNFQTDGKFDEKQMEKMLKYMQRTREEYEADLREARLRTRLQAAVSGLTIGEAGLELAFREANTTVNLEVVQVHPAAVAGGFNPTDEEKASWLKENEALLKETYDRDFERRYNHPEQVGLLMIKLVDDPADSRLDDLKVRLEKLRDQVAAGADFGELAKRWSEDPTAFKGGDLGLRAVKQLSDAEVAGLTDVPVGSLSKVVVIEGKEVRLFKVTDRKEAYQESFESVKAALADELFRAERLPKLALEVAESKLLAAWGDSGSLPQPVMDQYGLVATPTGLVSTQARPGFGNPPAELLTAARSAEVGKVLPEVYEKDGTYWVARLLERQEPDRAAFDEAKADMARQALRGRRDSLFGGWVEAQRKAAQVE